MRDQIRVRGQYVVLRMTHKQLTAVFHALSNSVGDPDAMEALFSDGHRRRAAYAGAGVIARAAGMVYRGDRGTWVTCTNVQQGERP